MSASRIIANQSHLSRALQLSNMRIKLYVRDEAHYSGYTTRQLAKLLSTGYTTDTGYVVPARPFLRQFFAENKIMITEVIETYIAKKLKNREDLVAAWNHVAEELLNELRIWMRRGSVSPENSPFTVDLKGSSSPIIDKGQLLAALAVEVTVAPVKQ